MMKYIPILGISLIIAVFLACTIQSHDSLGDFRVTYVDFFHKDETGNANDPFLVWVYNTRTGEKTTDSMDFWPQLYRLDCGDDRWTQDSHRFKNVQPDLSGCRELEAILTKYGEPSFDVFKVSGTSCNQTVGLLGLTVRLYQSFDRLPAELDGPVARDRLQSATACAAFVLYDDVKDTVIFVDSIHLNPLSCNFSGGFWAGYIDRDGLNFYYRKRASVIKYDIASGHLDTIQGFSDPVIPSNHMAVLAYSEDRDFLALLDDQGEPVATVRGRLGKVFSTFAVSDSVFVVAAVDTDRSLYPPMAFTVYDFTQGKRKKLFTAGRGQILDVERILSPK